MYKRGINHAGSYFQVGINWNFHSSVYYGFFKKINFFVGDESVTRTDIHDTVQDFIIVTGLLEFELIARKSQDLYRLAVVFLNKIGIFHFFFIKNKFKGTLLD